MGVASLKYVKGIDEKVNISSSLKSAKIENAMTYGAGSENAGSELTVEGQETPEVEAVNFDEYGLENEMEADTSPSETETPEIEAFEIEELVDYSTIKEDGFLAQGYTIVTDENGNSKVIISGHPIDESDPDAKSRLYVYDKSSGKLEGYIILTGNDHVGGVTYDYDNGILFVAGDNGNVNTYNYQNMISILNDSEGKEGNVPNIDLNNMDYEGNMYGINVQIPNDISVLDAINEDYEKTGNYENGMDSIYFHNGKLYSCTYGGTGELVCSEYTYGKDDNGKPCITSDKPSYVVGKLNGAVQGLAFYEDSDGTTYLVTASSSGNTPIELIGSRLTKWIVNEDGSLQEVGYIYIWHDGLEGIEIDSDGNITGVFEYDKQKVEDLGNIDDFSIIPDLISDVGLHIGGNNWDKKHGEKEPEQE